MMGTGGYCLDCYHPVRELDSRDWTFGCTNRYCGAVHIYDETAGEWIISHYDPAPEDD